MRTRSQRKAQGSDPTVVKQPKKRQRNVTAGSPSTAPGQPTDAHGRAPSSYTASTDGAPDQQLPMASESVAPTEDTPDAQQPPVDSVMPTGAAREKDIDPLGKTLLQRLRELTSQLPSSVLVADGSDILAYFSKNPCASILPEQDAWEDLIDPALNRIFGFGKQPDEIAQFIRRGPLGMDGFCSWIETCITDLKVKPALLEMRLERVFNAIKLL